ncbi:MAG TPA: RNA 2',3'-cyclic phosphodiesterase [Bryobacteraceae bacterium]|nr:RNA 2',3'-cyclic phosphodiesterase [Bryobacteraceae bacterium]
MRLFVGIPIAGHVLDNLARVLKQLRPLAPVRWSPVENFHITSRFIGEWPEEKLEALEAALEEVKTPTRFEISIAGFGYFPNPHHPRTLFAAVHSGPQPGELAARVDESLLPLGIAKEDRPYSPHLTLAKIKHENIQDLRDHLANMTNFDFGTFPVTEFHLYLSQPGPKGSVYSSLAVYPIAAASSQAGHPR